MIVQHQKWESGPGWLGWGAGAGLGGPQSCHVGNDHLTPSPAGIRGNVSPCALSCSVSLSFPFTVKGHSFLVRSRVCMSVFTHVCEE